MNKFLSIVWYKVLPPVYGGQKGIAHFNEHLANRIALTCLCSKNNASKEKLNYQIKAVLPTSKLQFWNPVVRSKILNEIKSQDYDHVIIEHPYHGWLGKHKMKLGFKFIVHAHNIEFTRMRSRGLWWWRIIRAVERNAFRNADHILFKTEDDRKYAIEHFGIDIERALVVPYGINRTRDQPEAQAEVRSRHGIRQTEKIILFAASFDYAPNIEAVGIVKNELLPRLRKSRVPFKIVICGKMASHLYPNEKEVIIAGEVNDVSAYMMAADVFINPVTKGSGIQTKNIDALSYGLPIVSTKFAAKGLPDYLIPQHLNIAENDDWQKFATLIISALEGKRMSEQRFFQDYYWGNIVDRFVYHITMKG